MIEKRELKRRHLIYYLRVYNGESKSPIGFMVDIHFKGIMLISDEPIKTNKHFDLKMELPRKTGDKSHVEFSAKSLWCKKSVNSDFFESGFSLEKIDEESLAAIDNIIKYFGFRD